MFVNQLHFYPENGSSHTLTKGCTFKCFPKPTIFLQHTNQLSLMNYKTGIFLASLLLFCAVPGISKEKKEKKYNSTKNTISLIDVYNTGPYKFSAKPGLTSVNNRHNNFGVAYRRDMYVLPHDFYISAGFRWLTTESEAIVRTNLIGFDPYGSKFTFRQQYRELSIPVYIGRSIPMKFFPKANLDVFAGGSVGASKIKSYDVGRLWQNEQNNTNILGVQYEDFAPDASKILMNATLDAGFQFTPFGTPKLSLGCALSYNLLSTPGYKDKGAFGNATMNRYDNFNLDYSRRLVNVLFSVNYSIGRKW